MPRAPSILAAALLALLPAAAPAQPSLPAVVLFDTVCLQCHAAACSGRLALKPESQGGIAGHVERYAGPQAAAMVAELQGLLVRLKTGCALTPPAVEPPADGVWGPEALRPLTLADRRGAFVPLGTLPAGRQRLSLTLDPPQRIRVQVMSAAFDLIADDTVQAGPAESVVAWEGEEDGPAFVRVTAAEGMGRLSLRLRPP